MSNSAQGQGHRQTWLALILTFVLLLPGLVIGRVGGFAYLYVLKAALRGDMYDWLIASWYSKIALIYAPIALGGGIAGAAAILVTSRVFRRANYESVMHAMLAMVAALTFAVLATIQIRYGVQMVDGSVELLAITASALGIAFGLYGGHTQIK